MKIRSLVLGSVAAAGLSTAGFAADLGVLTSLDVCDNLGLSGLTISSVPLIVLYLFAQRQVREGIATGGVR